MSGKTNLFWKESTQSRSADPICDTYMPGSVGKNGERWVDSPRTRPRGRLGVGTAPETRRLTYILLLLIRLSQGEGVIGAECGFLDMEI